MACFDGRTLDSRRSLLDKDGIACITIDDYELHNLAKLIEQIYDELAGTVAIRIKPSGRPIPNGFALAHEYALFARNNDSTPIRRLERTAEQMARYLKMMKSPFFGKCLEKQAQTLRVVIAYDVLSLLFSSNGELRLPKATYDPISEVH